MFEKVNPNHPDKIADRIAGAFVDLAYTYEDNPKVAVEVLIGHGICHIIAESSVKVSKLEVQETVHRITQDKSIKVDYKCVRQDILLANNQLNSIKCGDNGIFKGMPLTEEQKILSFIVRDLYGDYHTDGKYIINNNKLIACQSNVEDKELKEKIQSAYITESVVNPLGYWTGGINVDTGATNRKLGSDMGDSVTGGGLHGKDLSKADVSVNIYAFLKAQETGKPIELCCAIGDEHINDIPYKKIVETAKEYIKSMGGFEKFAEWGLVR